MSADTEAAEPWYIGQKLLASSKGQDGLSTYSFRKYPARVIKVHKVGTLRPRYLLDLRFSNNGTIEKRTKTAYVQVDNGHQARLPILSKMASRRNKRNAHKRPRDNKDEDEEACGSCIDDVAMLPERARNTHVVHWQFCREGSELIALAGGKKWRKSKV